MLKFFKNPFRNPFKTTSYKHKITFTHNSGKKVHVLVTSDDVQLGQHVSNSIGKGFGMPQHDFTREFQEMDKEFDKVFGPYGMFSRWFGK